MFGRATCLGRGVEGVWFEYLKGQVFDEGVDVANNANGYSAIMQDARGRMWMVRYRMGF